MWKRFGSLLAAGIVCFLLSGNTAYAGTIYDSPYVSFSPDGEAFTTNLGDEDVEWYEDGYTIDTGLESSVRQLETGEHYYYSRKRKESIPIGEWKVAWEDHRCIHEGVNPYHGIQHSGVKCRKELYSGWFAYCADCGQELPLFIYMSEEAAASIDYLDITKDYYYICPFSGNLEQGAGFPEHNCKGISWNKYMVIYKKNGATGGHMADTVHMYNNEKEYEGNPITPDEKLRKNAYYRTGYEFVGWNTEEDGSGQWFSDGQEVLNLTDKDYNQTAEANITLFAQWQPTRSTLAIDPAGGTYDGSTEVASIEGQYGSVYHADPGRVAAPDGATVTFHAMGGSAVPSITGTRHFREWKQGAGFAGKWGHNHYTFQGPEGHTDTLSAVYDRDGIVLPEAVRSGYSFCGWYEDEKCTVLAGNAGDEIIPVENKTLYAGWVSLLLTATDDYVSHGGKGAVDLFWSQPDKKDKTYQVLQQKESGAWEQLASATEKNDSPAVSKSFPYAGYERTYTVPYTGTYLLTAAGAQGGGYGIYRGGKGGSVTARFFLEKGEKLTYATGGQNGYGGGGSASAYGSGGGFTKVTSDRKGTLLIAGGGGGASPSGNGGSGGSSASLTGTASLQGAGGQNGMAGGGGGYRGGTAGENIIHRHTAACYIDTSVNILGTNCEKVQKDGYEENDEEEDWDDETWKSYDLGSMAKPIPVEGNTNLSLEVFQGMNAGKLSWDRGADKSYVEVYNQKGELLFRKTIADIIQYTNSLNSEAGGNTVRRHDGYDAAEEEFTEYDYRFIEMESGKYGYCTATYDEDDRLIDKTGNWTVLPSEDIYVLSGMKGYETKPLITLSGTSWHYQWMARFCYEVPIPEGTTGIYIKSYYSAWHYRGFGLTNSIRRAALTGGRKLICGYTEGQVISSKPAYGGSNYINTAYTGFYQDSMGTQEGNGSFSIQGESLGYQMGESLPDVMATDLAAPCAPDETLAEITPAGLDSLQIRWEEPEDKGTLYRHQVTSYTVGKDGKLTKSLDSNITENTLITGVKEYFYKITAEEEAPSVSWADIRNASSGWKQTDKETPWVTAVLQDYPQYLCVTASDKAGNLSEAAVIPIPKRGETAVNWKISTGQIQTEEKENVYRKSGTKEYFVKADGEAFFPLSFGGYMAGSPSRYYQLNEMDFVIRWEGNEEGNTGNRENGFGEDATREEAAGTEWFSVTYPFAENATEEGSVPAGELEKGVTEPEYLSEYSLTEAARADKGRELFLRQCFTVSPDYHGMRLSVIPRTKAENRKTGISEWSEEETDNTHGLILIPDGEAPVITGTEVLETLDTIDRENGEISLLLMAQDDLSGLKDLVVYIQNQDNYCERTYLAENGKMNLSITEDEPLFYGDFTITVRAVDNVGNVREETYSTTEFSLTAEVTRILEPHTPAFQCGESGILTITTIGYADKVEVIFPEEMTALNPDLNRTYLYENPDYEQVESQQFMVPIYTPEGSYEIVVNAYKDGRRLHENPKLGVAEVSGSILDEIRTRLR